MSRFANHCDADQVGISFVYAEGDGTTVWVHDGPDTVARFGKVGFEVHGTDRPRPLLICRQSAEPQDWLTFKAKVLEVHGYDIEGELTPRRFYDHFGMTPGSETGHSVFRVKVAKILEFMDPFQDDIWGRDRLTIEAVRHAVESGNLASSFVEMGMRPNLTGDWDARRVAHFVVHPDDWPISIEFTSPSGIFEIPDGWHRLAAATYRGDEEIGATLAGFVDGWDVIFPDRVPLDAPNPVATLASLR